ncbi:MAG: PhoH family protein [Clostridia bacterium]|nr:PhoH family protein [Clostridia bacterium]
MTDIFGPYDCYVTLIEKALNVAIRQKDTGTDINGGGEDVCIAAEVLETLKQIYSDGNALSTKIVEQAIDFTRAGKANAMIETMRDAVAVDHKGKPVFCKSLSQKQYVKKIRENTVTICTGPAGTGKTYLAIALAVTALKRKEISNIILTRPAVEAGEKLGFLPGDLQEKVDPYLTPLYDALNELLGSEKLEKLEERGIIEAAPLAFMRGRTLKNSFIVLDEAQNCTISQMKMFLTRLGENSKMIVTGDATQTDLPSSCESGLKHAWEILGSIDGIATHNFDKADVVRHPLVQKIIEAYERDKQS